MDSRMVRRARDGDPRARKALGSWLHHELIAFFGKGKFKESDRVSDLIQETVVDVLAKLAEAPDDPDAFRRWVHSFAGTEVRTVDRDRDREHGRANLRARGPTPPPLSASASVLGPLIDEQQRAMLIEHARQLRPVYRNALLHVLDGGDYKSLAASEGIPVGTASSRLDYATKMVGRSIEAARTTRPSCRTPPRRA
jgi:DNA-directed RNA polymerase specialized sigma24 family protein